MKKRSIQYAAVCLLAMLTIVVNFTDWLVWVDEGVYGYVINSRTIGLDSMMLIATDLAGLEVTAFVILTGVASLVIIKKYHMALVLVLVSLLDILLIDFLKNAFSRLRPPEISQMVHEGSFSYPSAHVMSAVFIYGVYVHILSTHIKSEKSKIALRLSWVCFVILVSGSRIYLGVHFATDVMASWLLGGLLLSIFISNYRDIRSFKFKTLMIKLVS